MIPACPIHGNQCVSHAKQWIVDHCCDTGGVSCPDC